jgi:hypothetical protein
MAATVELRCFTETNAATESGAITGIDFISADNAVNSLANRTANPISIPDAGSNYSFEKWLKLRITAAPANSISNIKFWTDGSFAAGTGVKYGTTATGATPGQTVSTKATIDAATATSGAKATWDSGSYSTTGVIANFLVLQLNVTTTALQGNWNGSGETFYYSYDEM